MEINRRTNPGTARGAGNLVGKDIEQIKNIPGIKKYIKRMNVSADLIGLEPLKLANHRLEENKSENNPMLHHRSGLSQQRVNISWQAQDLFSLV